MKLSYLKYFFTYETDIADGIGFEMFHLEHFLWLFICVLVTGLVLHYYSRADDSGKEWTERIVAYSMPVWMLIRVVYILIIHEDMVYELPLHLCSISGLLCALHCMTRWKWVEQVLYVLGLPGALLAMVFPNWTYYPAIHFITIESFLFHLGIVVYVLIMLYSNQIVPKVKNMWQVIIFLAVTVSPVYAFDKHFHTNYMFVNWPSAGSPLELIYRLTGEGGYLFGFAVLVLFFILLMYTGYWIIQKLFL